MNIEPRAKPTNPYYLEQEYVIECRAEPNPPPEWLKVQPRDGHRQVTPKSRGGVPGTFKKRKRT